MNDGIKKIEPPKYIDEFFEPDMLCDEMQQLMATDQLLKKQIKEVQGNCSHVFVKTRDRCCYDIDDGHIALTCRNCGMASWRDPMDIVFG